MSGRGWPMAWMYACPGVFGFGKVMGELSYSVLYYGICYGFRFFVVCVTARVTEHGKSEGAVVGVL